MDAEDQRKANKAMDTICNHELSSNMSRSYVRSCQEPLHLVQWFPKGFIILNGKRASVSDTLAKIRAKSLFRIIAPYGKATRGIQQDNITSMALNNHEAFLLMDNEKGYFWKGGNCNQKEIELG